MSVMSLKTGAKAVVGIQKQRRETDNSIKGAIS